MIITLERGDGDDSVIATLEVDDDLLELALDKPDFIAGEVREFLYKVFDE